MIETVPRRGPTPAADWGPAEVLAWSASSSCCVRELVPCPSIPGSGRPGKADVLTGPPNSKEEEVAVGPGGREVEVVKNSDVRCSSGTRRMVSEAPGYKGR